MDNKASSGGIGFGGLLTIVFILLKLLDKIDWPWFSLVFWEPSVFITFTIALWIFVISWIILFIIKLIERLK